MTGDDIQVTTSTSTPHATTAMTDVVDYAPTHLAGVFGRSAHPIYEKGRTEPIARP